MNLADHEPYKSLAKDCKTCAQKQLRIISISEEAEFWRKETITRILELQKANKGIARLKRKIERLTRETLEEK